MDNLIAAAIAGLLPISSLLPGSGDMDWGSSSLPSPAGDRPGPSEEAPVESEVQKEMREALNRFREDNGVAPVKALTELNVVAQDWADQMAKDDRMRHNPLYTASYPRGWMFAGENVAQNWEGVEADELIAQWAESDGHRRNMLDTRFTHAGFGLATTEDGKVYAVQDFAQYAVDPVDGPPAEPRNPGEDDEKDADKDKDAKDNDEATTDSTDAKDDKSTDSTDAGESTGRDEDATTIGGDSDKDATDAKDSDKATSTDSEDKDSTDSATSEGNEGSP
ncbi:CAP domain-containing protein [Corynebacterium sp. 335C]